MEDHPPYASTRFEAEISVPITPFGVDVSPTTITSAKFTTAPAIGTHSVLAARERSLVPGRL